MTDYFSSFTRKRDRDRSSKNANTLNEQVQLFKSAEQQLDELARDSTITHFILVYRPVYGPNDTFWTDAETVNKIWGGPHVTLASFTHKSLLRGIKDVFSSVPLLPPEDTLHYKFHTDTNDGGSFLKFEVDTKKRALKQKLKAIQYDGKSVLTKDKVAFTMKKMEDDDITQDIPQGQKFTLKLCLLIKRGMETPAEVAITFGKITHEVRGRLE